MRYLNDAITVAKVFTATACSVGVLLGATVSAQSSGTDVSVRVCPQVSSASLAITQPVSDSKTNNPKITVEGDVEYISQIDFFIDDVYDHTIALGYATTSFKSSLTVAPGTHTLRLEAIDSCSPEPLTDSVVITYQPEAQPSIGSDVITDIPSFSNDLPPGGVIGIPIITLPGGEEALVTDKSPKTPPKSSPNDTNKQRVYSNLDTGAIFLDQRLDVWLRALAVILGIVLLFAPWRVLLVTDYIRQGLVDHVGKQVKSHAEHPHIRLAGRIVGTGLLLLAFLV